MPQPRNITKNNKGGGFLVLLIILAMLGGGGYFAYSQYLAKKGPGNDFRKDFQHLASREEILLLTYAKLPKIYQTLVEFENQVITINQEITRLNEMEKEFPQQLDIIAEEKTIWTEALQELTTTFAQIENEIEILYVSYQVNPAKGSERLEGKRTELLALASEQIKASQELTGKLRKPALKKKKFLIF